MRPRDMDPATLRALAASLRLEAVFHERAHALQQPTCSPRTLAPYLLSLAEHYDEMASSADEHQRRAT